MVGIFFFIKWDAKWQTALNNSTSDAESESWFNKNSKHFKEIFGNSSLFSTSLVFVERTSAHLSFNFSSDSQSIVYCRTVKTFSAQILLIKKVSQWLISGSTKYFFARIEKYYWGFIIFVALFCIDLKWLLNVWFPYTFYAENVMEFIVIPLTPLWWLAIAPSQEQKK